MLLSFMFVYGAVVWCIRLFHNISDETMITSLIMDELPCVLVFVVNILLMMELNNRNALLRTYSRSVSSTYILLMLLTPTFTADLKMLLLQFCFILFLLLLFSTYQNRGMIGKVFFAYLSIGFASLIWLPIVVLIPILVILQRMYIYSFNFKAFCAMLLALITPYWMLLPLFLKDRITMELPDNLSSLLPSLENIFPMREFSWGQSVLSDNVLIMSVVAFAMVGIMCLCSIIHYVRKSYEDKIHVRMLFYFFCWLMILFLMAEISLFMLPIDGDEHFYMLMMLTIVTASPLIGHFITFTHTRMTNIFTIAFGLIAIVLTVINVYL